jgi:hypothetical protein
MTTPPTLDDLMGDVGELDVTCLDCHHNTTMPVAALAPRQPILLPVLKVREVAGAFDLGEQGAVASCGWLRG